MKILNKEDIQKAYAKLKKQIAVYKENQEYFRGANPEILKKQRKKDPDNRVPIPLAKSTTEDMTGYAGADITIRYEAVDDKNKKTIRSMKRRRTV